MRPTLVMLTAGIWLIWGACRQNIPERKYYAVSGEATEIDVESGWVGMDWRNDKTGAIEPLRGRVTHTTEIFINGISASLEDIRPGDRGIVVVYRASDPQEHWVVTSVSVERNESYMLHRPGAPAAPAGR